MFTLTNDHWAIDIHPLLNLRGIYVWMRDGEALYVGGTSNFIKRLSQHHAVKPELVEPGDVVRFFPVDDVEYLGQAENKLIEIYQPKLNARNRDGTYRLNPFPWDTGEPQKSSWPPRWMKGQERVE